MKISQIEVELRCEYSELNKLVGTMGPTEAAVVLDKDNTQLRIQDEAHVWSSADGLEPCDGAGAGPTKVAAGGDAA